ncbi:cytosine permease [Vibrio viridaestus]|uniref:Cytosine permease n=1 Tax=Vibrio viridaestus TaxID=2487322 RepID=A0A3N9U4T5_9VIBR|nr:cytosine permease [Vibrio viridaestus]RQW64672.1 cytosine permease [Vibrio viridaestus]
MNGNNDYPLSEVPQQNRKGLISMAAVLLGFTFFTSTMWAGGSLGTAFSITDLMPVLIVGNLILGIYAAALGYIAYKTGLNTVLLGRYCFGEVGSKLSDFVLGFTQIGWYAWGVATIAIVLTKLCGLDASWEVPLMIVFGFGFCISASIGYRAMEIISKISVPLMLVFIGICFYKGFIDAQGIAGLVGIQPKDNMTFSAAVTVVIGTFISGGTQATNWSRFSKTGKTAVIATLLAFFIGNGLMIFVGAFGAMIYQQSDIVDVLVAQGFMLTAVLMLFANIWTTQDNTIYNFAAAGCNLFRTEKRRLITIVGAGIGTLLAIFGMYNYLIPFLVLLGTFIPPIGAIIMTNFWLVHKGNPPKLNSASLPAFDSQGLSAYILGSAAAYASPWMPPIIGMVTASICYAILVSVFSTRGNAARVS